MGMDVYGKMPKSSTGEYFRNSVWWWKPLWDYVCRNIKLPETVIVGGHFNDGESVDDETATAIGKKLLELIDSGHTAEHENARQMVMESLPDELCDVCNGTGRREDVYVKGICNACNGDGTKRPFDTMYKFDVDNVRHFANFCLESGGFEIC